MMRSFTIWKQFHIAQLISSSRMTSSFFVSILSKRMKQLRLRVGFWVWAKSYSSRMMTVQNNLFIRAHAITSIYVKSTGSSSSSGKFSPLMQKWLLQGFFSSPKFFLLIQYSKVANARILSNFSLFEIVEAIYN